MERFKLLVNPYLYGRVMGRVYRSELHKMPRYPGLGTEHPKDSENAEFQCRVHVKSRSWPSREKYSTYNSRITVLMTSEASASHDWLDT